MSLSLSGNYQNYSTSSSYRIDEVYLPSADKQAKKLSIDLNKKLEEAKLFADGDEDVYAIIEKTLNDENFQNSPTGFTKKWFDDFLDMQFHLDCERDALNFFINEFISV